MRSYFIVIMKIDKRGIIQVIILISIYILLGNARSIEQNPFIPGATIAVNMIVPVIAGILFGPKCGVLTGIFGTLLNSFTPAGSIFELLAILPHGLMGLFAGLLNKKVASPIAALTLSIGHALNLLFFTAFGLILPGTFRNPDFWLGTGYEVFIGIIAIILITTIYRLAIRID